MPEYIKQLYIRNPFLILVSSLVSVLSAILARVVDQETQVMASLGLLVTWVGGFGGALLALIGLLIVLVRSQIQGYQTLMDRVSDRRRV